MLLCCNDQFTFPPLRISIWGRNYCWEQVKKGQSQQRILCLLIFTCGKRNPGVGRSLFKWKIYHLLKHPAFDSLIRSQTEKRRNMSYWLLDKPENSLKMIFDQWLAQRNRTCYQTFGPRRQQTRSSIGKGMMSDYLLSDRGNSPSKRLDCWMWRSGCCKLERLYPWSLMCVDCVQHFLQKTWVKRAILSYGGQVRSITCASGGSAIKIRIMN